MSLQLHKKINAKGYREQERGYLFGGLYSGDVKKVTKRFKGSAREFDNQLKVGKHER